MKTIEIDGNVGDEITLVYGDKSLIVKLSDDGIVPDFVDAFCNAFPYSAYHILQNGSAVYHKYHDAEPKFRYALSYARDQLFDSIKPIVEAVEDDDDVEIDATEEPTQTDDESENADVEADDVTDEEATEIEQTPPKKTSKKTKR